MLDPRRQQPAPHTLTAMNRPHRQGQQLHFIDGEAPQGKAAIAIVDPQQHPHDTRGQELRQVPSRPGALAEGDESFGMHRSGAIEVESAERRQHKVRGHSVDCASRAVGQGDVDAAEVERPWQAFALVLPAPGFDAGAIGEARQDNGIRNGLLGAGIDTGRSKLIHQDLRAYADDVARPPVEPRRQSACRGDERLGIALADGAKPVAQPAVDSGDGQTTARHGLGEQHRSRAEARQGYAKSDGEPARRRQTHADAGEAARPDGDREKVEIAPPDARFGEKLLDRWQQLRGLIAPFLNEGGKAIAVLYDGDTQAADRAVERQDRGHRSPRRALAPARSAGHSGIMKLDLVAIAPPDFDVDVMLAYATEANLTGRPVYRNAECWLQRTAAEKLADAIALARPLGLRFRIFDALRPVEAQWALWNVNPDPEFLADPRRGSPHSRGVAVDLTLLDGDRELDMGTPFDAFTPLSHHARIDVSPEAQRNRLLLMGLMTSAGWDFYRNEWWHYQLFDQRRYPLVSDADLPRPMM